MSKIIIFGTGEIAELANFYFSTDTLHEVIAFTVDKEYITADEFEGKPVIAFEKVEKTYPPGEYKMFIALSYAQLNSLRKQKYDQAKAKGYSLESYISSRCSYLSTFLPGDNCFILEDNTIQPFVKIGNNVTIWSGNHLGHHSLIEHDIFISSHVVISGHCTIGSGCFLGVNATIANNVTIGKKCIVGAGTIISASTEEESVYVPARSVRLDKKSSGIKL